MSLILNIDTATEKAHVSFAKNGMVLHSLFSDSQKEHASFLQSAIQQLTKVTGIPLSAIDAVAITSGPGSYTGLRVGFSSAKGLSYALNKPLITLGTLEILTASAIHFLPHIDDQVLFCPMMDARRMEVYTAIYKKELTPILSPSALILDEFSFNKELLSHKILFFGSGSEKWKAICKNSNAIFENVLILPEAMSRSSNMLFLKNHFTELVYSEPAYLKEFQTVIKK